MVIVLFIGSCLIQRNIKYKLILSLWCYCRV